MTPINGSWDGRILPAAAMQTIMIWFFRSNGVPAGLPALNPRNAIVPEEDDAYFTGVTMTVYDNLPCSGTTEINYWLSIDDGGYLDRNNRLG